MCSKCGIHGFVLPMYIQNIVLSTMAWEIYILCIKVEVLFIFENKKLCRKVFGLFGDS
jgi:hypothetical protein